MINREVDAFGLKAESLISLYRSALIAFLLVGNCVAGEQWTQESTAAIETDYNNDGISDIVLMRKRLITVPYNIDLFFDQPDESYVLYGISEEDGGGFQMPAALAPGFVVGDYLALKANVGEFVNGEGEILVRTYDAVDPNADQEAGFFSAESVSYIQGGAHKATVIVGGLAESNPTVNTYVNTNFRGRSTENVEKDVMVAIDPANASRISINPSSIFNVSANPLQILNLSPSIIVNEDGDEIAVLPPLVVIVADSIELSNQIELVGPASDILFVATGDGASAGTIACNDCEFKNFHRVTFAVADREGGVFSNEITSIGRLNSAQNGSISISNLTAPGVLGFEALASNITLTGEINTHQRVVKDFLGGYVNDDAGDLVMGSGSVSLLMGGVDWNYEEQEIKQATVLGLNHQLSGSIKSVNINITSSEGLILDSNIDTRTDLLSSIRYRNQLYILNEEVFIQTLGDALLDFEAGIWQMFQIDSAIHSNGSIDLKSFTNINLESLVNEISGGSVELTAGAAINNSANITASNSIYMAGDAIENEGDLVANFLVELWAENSLSNQYGGKISGKTVDISAKKGAVRNGSRTPYKSIAADKPDLLTITDDYFNTLDPLRTGIFYSNDFNVETSSVGNLVMALDSSAHILGETITINGAAFENINPYYENVSPDNSAEEPYYNGLLYSNEKISLDVDKVKQISVSAEKVLDIETENYILNSSAHMLVQAVDGTMALKTASLLNERYRVLNGLKKTKTIYTSTSDPLSEKADQLWESGEYLVRYGDFGFYDKTEMKQPETFEDRYETRVLSYSPQGLIVSLGDIAIEASSSFVNNLGYFEIFGNASFNSPIVHDLGLENSSVSRSLFEVTFLDDTGERESFNCSFYLARFYPGLIGDEEAYRACAFSGTTRVEGAFNRQQIDVDPQEADSLFYIKGAKTVFDKEYALFRNHKPLDSYVSMAAQNALDKVVDPSAINEDIDYPSSYVINSVSISNPTDLDNENVANIYDTGNINVGVVVNFEAFSELYGVLLGSQEVVIEYSLFDQLAEVYDEVVSMTTDLFEEIDWWLSEE